MVVLIWLVFIVIGLIVGSIAFVLFAKFSFILACILALICFGVLLLVGGFILHGPQFPPSGCKQTPSRAAPFVLGALFSYWLHHRN